MALSVCQEKGELDMQRNQMTCAERCRELAITVGHLMQLFIFLGLV